MRTYADLRRRLEEAAKKTGSSLAREVERRLERSFEAEDLLEQAREHYAEASAEKSAARIAAIRQAGWQIVREHGGGKVTVNVSPELLLAEADGILRSGFVAAENVDKSPTEIAIENAVERALAKFMGERK